MDSMETRVPVPPKAATAAVEEFRLADFPPSVQKALAVFDQDNSGTITVDELGEAGRRECPPPPLFPPPTPRAWRF